MPLRLRLRPAAVPGHTDAERVERAVELDTTAEIRVGRRSGLEISLPFTTISGLHAQLVRTDGGWVVEDLGSTNGTFIGDERLPPKSRRRLAAGQVLRFADVDVVFEGETSASPSDEVEGTGTIARRLVNDLFAVMGGEAARIVVENGTSAGHVLRLAQAERRYTLGRADNCDSALADEDVSREHAALVRRWNGVELQDLGSKNGVLIAGLRALTGRILHDGEVLRMGNTDVRFEDPEEHYLRRMEAAPGGRGDSKTAATGGRAATSTADAPPASDPPPLVEPVITVRQEQPRVARYGTRLAIAALVGVLILGVWILAG